jgi:predicted ATP-grasp superfamily ATP-dependent carboligase
MNQPVSPTRGKPGVRWMRLLTDLPTAAVAILKSEVSGSDYLRSLMDVDEEAVFSGTDPLPGLMECALVPYLVLKRGY